jgi:cholesterol transport system auxiliary component
MRALAGLLALAALGAGCSGGTGGGQVARSYDFGIEAPAARLPAVRVGAVRAAAPFDSNEMFYRLAYRDPAELLAFVQSRWAAAPADLYRKQLLRAADGVVGRCALEVELHEVSQVFSSKESSEALIELRARLADGDGTLAEKRLRVAQSDAGGTAAAGAAAMAKAAERSIGELAGWIAAQPRCGGAQVKP